MTTVRSFSTMDAASFDAASGKHKITQSASLINLFLSFTSFLNSSAIDITSKSSLLAKRSRTCKPVVPASPSMKIFFLAPASATAVREEEEMREKMEDVLNAFPSFGAVEAMATKSERADVLVNILLVRLRWDRMAL